MTRIKVDKVERKNFDGYYYPVDQYGHAGEIQYDVDRDAWFLVTTDPYDQIAYAVGNEDDFVCFDYLILEAHVAIHATINSETGSFIDTFEYAVVPWADAVDVAQNMVDLAVEWAHENDVPMTDEDIAQNEKAYSLYADIENDLSHREDPMMA